MPRRFAYIGTAGVAGATQQQPTNFGPGSWSWSPPRGGAWKFVAWAPGGGCNAGNSFSGSTGSYAEITKLLHPTDTVTISVGSAGALADTIITFPDAHVVTCPHGLNSNNVATATPTGGDVNLPGLAGRPGVGQDAPSRSPYHGGAANTNVDKPGYSPGGVAAGGSTVDVIGGDGLVLAVLLHD